MPGALAAVIARCLKKAPAARFPSAAQIVESLTSDGEAPLPATMTTRWWRTHQLTVVALYIIASALAWQIKEWFYGTASVLFITICIAATVGGVFRGHLVFTERMNLAALPAERRLARRVLLVTDVLIALALTGDGLLLAPMEQLVAVLTFGLAVGILLANLVLEPATTSAAFGPERAEGAKTSTAVDG